MRDIRAFSIALGTWLAAQSLIAAPALSTEVNDVWTTPAPLTEVNSSAEEWSPFLSYDGLTLYFTRMGGPNASSGRIYEAKRDTPSGPFTSVQEVRGQLNSVEGHVLCPWVSPDNLRMYYYTEARGFFTLRASERGSVDAPWPAGSPIRGLDFIQA